jgi:hypothetical protein
MLHCRVVVVMDNKWDVVQSGDIMKLDLATCIEMWMTETC